MSHLFRDCPLSQQVLRMMGVVDTICNTEPNWKKWLEQIVESQDAEMNTFRSIAYWAIWFNRNKIYHEGFRESVHGIIAFIKAYHAEINSMGQASRHANEVEKDTWTPPKDDTIRINFDASFNQHIGRSVSGILAQNKDGLIMAACTFPWENVPDPVMAEARACL